MLRHPARILALALPAVLPAALPPPADASAARVVHAAAQAGVVISAVFPDGFAPGDADEAVQLWNTGDRDVALAGWAVADARGGASFPDGARLPAGGHAWLTRDAGAFARSFGHPPDWAWGAVADPARTAALATIGGGPRLANAGDVLHLRRADGGLEDTVVYGRAATAEGWVGPAARAYRSAAIGGTHQVLHRKLDARTGRPVHDTGRAADWAGDPLDARRGRRARYPGWDLEAAVLPARVYAPARVEVAVAPDALYPFLARHLAAATRSVDVLAYTFEHPDLADILAARAAAGVRVRLLVEGAPAGGVDPAQRWCLARIAAAGGAVYRMDAGGDVRPRYRGAHAKLIVIDGRTVLVGTENPSLGAAPRDDLSDGTAGRRGHYVAIDAPAVAAHAAALVARDLDPVTPSDPDGHLDLRPFQPRDPARGAPAPDYVPPREGGGAGYAPVFARPAVFDGHATFELVTAPENALVPDAGLLGLLARAGPGAAVRVAQLDEPPWWGDPAEGDVARNPRVAAYIAAARRGATVRVLLDGHFDDAADARSNHRTAGHLNAVAAAEGLDLAARRGNPAGKGLHAKLVLVAHPRSGPFAIPAAWSHVGSLNGTEVASKVNREVAVQIESPAVHDYLATVFDHDWRASTPAHAWLPWAGRAGAALEALVTYDGRMAHAAEATGLSCVAPAH